MAPSSKRGLCWPVENQDPVFPFTKPGSKISWLYNWSPNPTPSSSSLEFIPMQWNTSGIETLPSKLPSRPAKPTLLTFNEPELPSQSNISAGAAAHAWLTHIEPLRAAGVRCGSPGISSAPDGLGWLRDFHARVRQGGGEVDFWSLHWYGEGLGGFYDYIWSTHHALDPAIPVWITEFAATNWSLENPLPAAEVEAFARESCAYLDTLDWVERYCWFGAMRDTGTVGSGARMIDDEGKLTALGRGYRGGW